MGATMVVEDFATATDPYRRELLAHCYRMLGSLHDAEDLVQETYLRAWRAYDRFEGRSSVRTWMYKIATTACLTALEKRKRRPLPTGLGGPSEMPGDELVERPEIPWLEPIPDSALVDDPADPASVVSARETTRLAFVAALQHLPARQRAVLVLREVFRWKAAEVAEVLGTSTTAVNSILQRARAQLAEVKPSQDDRPAPLTTAQQQLLDRYVSAFEAKDITAIVQLFTAEAIWEMPPFTTWVRGAEQIGRLVDLNCPAGPGDMRLLPTRANGQPAFGVYLRGPDGVYRPFHLHVLELDGDVVQHAVIFFDVSLFPAFGLPLTCPEPRD
ncbi:sigma-70 family RNA polymerase sigma factor [Saccharopolyspora indica]|uniref:sigma-70 family RNA polymerase sigma factor n=1 Tax=Saccharopolyspora indica TaxID=1229659 RepID=UPI002FDBD2F5